MNTLRVGVLCVMVACSSLGYTQEIAAPDFKNYPAKAEFSGKPAAPKLDTPDAQMYRTRLRVGATQPADFAGDHVLVLFGCGTACVQGAAVSHKTGRVVFLPGTVCCWYGEHEMLQYRPDSRLLIASGRINEDDQYGRFYYEFNGREFRLVHTELVDKEAHLNDFGEKMTKGLEEGAASVREKQQNK